MIALLLVMLTSPWQHTMAHICESVSAQPDVKLFGNVIETSSTPSGDDCLDKCRSHNNCSSINFDPGSEVCELNNANHVSSPEHLLPAKGFMYLVYPDRPPSKCSDKFCTKPFVCEIERKQGSNYTHKCEACHAGQQAFLLFPRRSIYDFAAFETSFGLVAFTAAIWVQLNETSSTDHTPFTYTTATGSEELGFYLTTTQTQILVTRYYWITVYGAPILVDGKWHHICLTWNSSDGIYKAYADGQLISNGVRSAGYYIKKGVVVLGQEQDGYKGGFQVDQSYKGNMTSFNLWDKVLSAQEISGLAQSFTAGEGNVIKWSEINVKGQGQVRPYCLS